MTQVPAIPFDPSKPNPFTLLDCWTACDVKLEGIAFECKQSTTCTLFSREVFPGSQQIDVTITVLDLLGSMVGVGLLGDKSTEPCCDHALGHSAVKDSIACAVGRNQVLIIFRGKTLFKGEANTTGRTEVRLELKEGRASFSVDGKKCECPEISALNLSKGKFRLGISPMKEGQTGLIGDVAAYVRLFGADSKVPNVQYDASKGFTFHDRWRSIDVTNGRELKCNATTKATCYSEQVVKGTTNLRQTLIIGRRGPELIAFGILGALSTKACSDYVLGEKEIPDSIGCLIRGDDFAIMYRDDLIYREERKIVGEIALSLVLIGGKLHFEVDGRALDSPKLAAVNLKDLTLRIGASLCHQSQIAQLLFSAATRDGTCDPRAANLTFDAEHGFTFHARRQNCLVEERRKVTVSAAGDGTTYSSEIFAGDVRTKQTVRFTERGSERVAFGVMDALQTASADTAGVEQKALNATVCVVHGELIKILHRGEELPCTADKSAPLPAADAPLDVSIVVAGSRIRFEVAGRPITCERLESVDLAATPYRLAISMAVPRQCAELITRGVGPALPEGVLEGDLDPRYRWSCWPDHAHIQDGTVTGKQKGSCAFSLEVLHCKAVAPGGICSACYRGDKNRRKFDGHSWKCDACDCVYCNDCYHNKYVKHAHDRKGFKKNYGGTFHEVRIGISELLGSSIDFGLAPCGLENTFGENARLFVNGGPSGWTNAGASQLADAAKLGDEVWLRLFNNVFTVHVNRKLVYRTTVDDQPYRAAVRFNRDGQACAMRVRGIIPARGTCMAMPDDRAFIEQEAQLVGLDGTKLPSAVRGWLVDEDADGTVRLCFDQGEVPAMWVPRTVVQPVPQRGLPPPCVCQLPDRTKVVRNLATWTWGDQDGSTRGNRIGQVISATKDGWTGIRWSNGKESIYRYARGVYHVMPWVGNVGDKVMRNPAFWTAGAVDGYGVGVVEACTEEGVLTVKWENGASTLCKFNEEAQDVQLAGPLKVPGLDAAADPDVPGEKKVMAAPPPALASDSSSGSVPMDRADLARGAEQETLMEVDLKPAMKLKPGYKPPEPLTKCMLDAASALPKITQMPYIVEECVPIAEQRRKNNGNVLELDESLAVVLYTYDLGTMSSSPSGADNFYFVLNEIFRSRDPQALFALQPFMYHFKMAWNKLPNQTGTFYRGIPKSALQMVSKMYTAGREVFWSSITSLSIDRRIAESFARKEGPGGILMEIQVMDSRSISAYSAIPRESEVILEPNTKLVVVQVPTPTQGCEHYVLKLLQVKSEKPFVF